ncbi:hypothetical protein [Agrococcus sp. ProA11]|uniref:hypothetical protein n=1 Tax=Agrococcus chionoecetis TaxID=3153752 RepID=UPI003261CC69
MSTITEAEAEAQRRIDWLAQASAEDLLKQYRSSITRMEAAVPLSDDYFEHAANVTLTERAMLKRMGA